MHSLLVDFSNFSTPVMLCIETTVLKNLYGKEEIGSRSDRKREHGERRKPHVLII